MQFLSRCQCVYYHSSGDREIFLGSGIVIVFLFRQSSYLTTLSLLYYLLALLLVD